MSPVPPMTTIFMIVSLFSGLCISNLSVVLGKAEFLTFRLSSEAVAKRMEVQSLALRPPG
jgi:hypothetical protein